MCRAALTGFDETMEYSMPSCSRNGEVEVAFASQKNFIGLYILRTDVMNAHKVLLKVKGVSFGIGCIRYSRSEKIDLVIVEKNVGGTLVSEGSIDWCDEYRPIGTL